MPHLHHDQGLEWHELAFEVHDPAAGINELLIPFVETTHIEVLEKKSEKRMISWLTGIYWFKALKILTRRNYSEEKRWNQSDIFLERGKNPGK